MPAGHNSVKTFRSMSSDTPKASLSVPTDVSLTAAVKAGTTAAEEGSGAGGRRGVGALPTLPVDPRRLPWCPGGMGLARLAGKTSATELLSLASLASVPSSEDECHSAIKLRYCTAAASNLKV
jgi:hypothetical protein